MIRFRKFLQLVFQMQPSCPIPWKWKFWDFQVLGSKFVKFLMSILNWQINSSSIFGSFFIVMTHNFPVNFKLIHFQLIPIKVPILRLSSALVKICQIPCHFWKHKSVFLQTIYKCWAIKHSSSVFPKLKYYILWS